MNQTGNATLTVVAFEQRMPPWLLLLQDFQVWALSLQDGQQVGDKLPAQPEGLVRAQKCCC